MQSDFSFNSLHLLAKDLLHILLYIHFKIQNIMEPEVAKKGPFAVELEAGKEYHWCACGKSKNQPFCDGSHHGSEFTPVVFTPEKAGKYFLCGCKHSQNKPFCDGTHAKL